MEATKTITPSYKEFLWTPNVIYKLVGYDFMQAPKPKWQRLAMNAFLVFSITCHLIGKLLMFIQMYDFMRGNDPLNAFRLAIYIAFSIDANIKCLAFVVNSKDLRRMHKTLRAEYPQTEEDFVMYRVDQHYWPFSVRCVMAAYYLVCYFILGIPLMQSCLQYIYDWLLTANGAAVYFAYLKPVPIEYQFDFHNAWIYVCVYTLEMMIGHTATNTNMGTDLWLIGFTMQLCMHLDYIGRRLETFEPSEENEIPDCEFLKCLMHKHQLMLSLHNDLNSIFGLSLAFNLISSTCLLCSIAVYVMIEGFGFGSLPWVLFLLTVIAQLYLLYGYGHQLIEASQRIATAAYSSRWHKGSTKYKRLLLMMMLRAQKQAELSAIGFMPISLNTFKMVMGMTYRVVAVLQTVLQ